MGFQNIIKLLKSNEGKLNYRHSKTKALGTVYKSNIFYELVCRYHNRVQTKFYYFRPKFRTE